MRFRGVVELGGRTATGVEVPADVVAALGSSRRPPVLVTIGGHTYPSTVASTGGRFMLPISAENRRWAGVAAGDEVEVDVVLDTSERVVTVPPDFGAALDAEPDARACFDRLPYSHQLRWVLHVDEAKAQDTRDRRIAKAVTELRQGRG